MRLTLACAVLALSGCINFSEEYWKYHPDAGVAGGGAATGGGTAIGGGTAVGGGTTENDGGTGGGVATGGGDGTTGGGVAMGGGAGCLPAADAGADAFLQALSVASTAVPSVDEATLTYLVRTDTTASSVPVDFTVGDGAIVRMNGVVAVSPFVVTLTSVVTPVSLEVQAPSCAVRTYLLTIVRTPAQTAYLKSLTLSQHFGARVAISAQGNRLVVGAPDESGGGGAYVFVKTGASWTLEAPLERTGGSIGDGFGGAVAINADGTMVAVGAERRSGGLGAGSGSVFLFSFDSTWGQDAELRASNAHLGDNFGFSVALSDDGNALVVGAPWESSSANTVGPPPAYDGGTALSGSGAAYLFVRDAGWQPSLYFKAPTPEQEARFGWSIALSSDGTTLAVGAPAADPGGSVASDNGAVYVFKSANWPVSTTLVGAQPAGSFGASVALDGNGDTLAVGASADSSEVASGGVALLFAYDGGWSDPARLGSPAPRAGDAVGTSVALSRDGLVCAIGAPMEAGDGAGVDADAGSWSRTGSGAVYTFVRSGADWARDSYLKASNAEADDHFGSAVSLSADGRITAIGASDEASNATGVGGDQVDNSTPGAGAGYVFTR